MGGQSWRHGLAESSFMPQKIVRCERTETQTKIPYNKAALMYCNLCNKVGTVTFFYYANEMLRWDFVFINFINYCGFKRVSLEKA